MDGAVRFPTDPFYADKYILGCSRPEEDGAPKVLLDANTPVIDKGDVYDGCNARMHVNFYAYKGGTGGINSDVYGVMKTGDNERLGNASPDSGSAFAGVQGAGPSTAQPVAPAQPGGVNLGQPSQQPVYQQPVQAQHAHGEMYAQPVAQPHPVYQQPAPVQQPVYQQPMPQPAAVQPPIYQPGVQPGQPVAGNQPAIVGDEVLF